MNLNKGCIEMRFRIHKFQPERWWTLTRVVLKYIRRKSVTSRQTGMNLNKGCIEIIHGPVGVIYLPWMNLNKGCIEIRRTDHKAQWKTGMNLNKGCIEIDERRPIFTGLNDEP